MSSPSPSPPLPLSSSLPTGRVVPLHGYAGPEAAARRIAKDAVHILIDLDGHTLHSGMSILSYRPAPLQGTFLGYSLTTGSDQIDFFIADKASLPPRLASVGFSEKVVYLPHGIATDYAALQSKTVTDPIHGTPGTDGNRSTGGTHGTDGTDGTDGATHRGRELGKMLQAAGFPTGAMRAMRDMRAMHVDSDGNTGINNGDLADNNKLNNKLLGEFTGIVFATFSNYRKMDPSIMATWANILLRVPDGILLIVAYAGHKDALPNIRREMAVRGVDGRRVVAMERQAWINHVRCVVGGEENIWKRDEEREREREREIMFILEYGCLTDRLPVFCLRYVFRPRRLSATSFPDTRRCVSTSSSTQA